MQSTVAVPDGLSPARVAAFVDASLSKRPTRPCGTYFMPGRQRIMSARTTIALKPYLMTAAVHAGAPKFKLSPSGEPLDDGDWKEPEWPCLASILTKVLPTFTPEGKPADLLTHAGKDSLARSVPDIWANTTHQATAPKPRG